MMGKRKKEKKTALKHNFKNSLTRVTSPVLREHCPALLVLVQQKWMCRVCFSLQLHMWGQFGLPACTHIKIHAHAGMHI